MSPVRRRSAELPRRRSQHRMASGPPQQPIAHGWSALGAWPGRHSPSRDARYARYVAPNARSGMQARAWARLGPRAKGSGTWPESGRNHALRAPILPRSPYDPPTVLTSSPERRQGSPRGVVALRRPPLSLCPLSLPSTTNNYYQRGQDRGRGSHMAGVGPNRPMSGGW